MLVSLERSGGFTGRRVTSSIDTGELSASQATEALQALDALASAPPAIPPGGASQPRYRLTVHRPSGQQVVEVVESQIPAALRPLLAELMRRPQPES
jgi:emfourin